MTTKEDRFAAKFNLNTMKDNPEKYCDPKADAIFKENKRKQEIEQLAQEIFVGYTMSRNDVSDDDLAKAAFFAANAFLTVREDERKT